MTMVEAVSAAVRRLGEATVYDLMPLFPGVDRGKLQKALRNAYRARLIAPKEIGIGGKNPKPATWHCEQPVQRISRAPAPKPLGPVVPVASAWDLATARPWEGNWPPGNTGRQYRTLGGWTE